MGLTIEYQGHQCDVLFAAFLPFPPSVNHMYLSGRGGRRLLTKKARQFFADCEHATRELHKPSFGKARYAVEIFLAMPDNRKRDIDNFLKSATDAMHRLGFIPDDSKMVKLTVERVNNRRGGGLHFRAAPVPASALPSALR